MKRITQFQQDFRNGNIPLQQSKITKTDGGTFLAGLGTGEDRGQPRSLWAAGTEKVSL